MRPLLRYLFILSVLFFSSFSNAMTPLPKVLKPWRAWVLEGYEEKLCPVAYNDVNQQTCVWPGDLHINVTNTTGNFTKTVTIYAPSYVSIPGDQNIWPQTVKANNHTIPVTQYDTHPSVYLSPGTYTITGTFHWNKIPDTLYIGKDTALLNLIINQEQITLPSRNLSGHLWLKPKKHVSEELLQNNTHIKVFRKISDAIPLTSTLFCQLQITGKPRELLIGPVLLPNAIPMDLRTQLPTLLEPDGKLRIQVKPGTWIIQLTSRYSTDLKEIKKPTIPSPWPSEEIWVFERNNALRLVDVTAPTSIDPQQTDLPPYWRNMPTFLMSKDSHLTLQTIRRGQATTIAPNLNLKRNIWLDFSGKGYTFLDHLNGSLSTNRLEMKKPITLGQVTLNDKKQLITKVSDNSLPGIEIRQGQINLRAVSRINFLSTSFPATGWNINLNQLSTTLHLPPGWVLLHASGVDNVPAAWIERWSLLDVFLVLIISTSAYYLLGRKWGAITLGTLILLYHETNAPIFIWLNLLAIIALLKILPNNRFKQYTFYYFIFSSIFWAIIVLPFMKTQLEYAIYPQLTKNISKTIMPQISLQTENLAETKELINKKEKPKLLGGPQRMHVFTAQKEDLTTLQDYDPQAKIQTGPGVPNWQGTKINLKWNDPVLKEQQLHLWLLPAWGKSIINIIQTILILLLGYQLIIPTTRNYFKKFFDINKSRNLAQIVIISLIFFGLGTTFFSPNALADIPDQPLRNTLRDRLLAPPKCLNHCADISYLKATINNNKLTLQLQAHAQERVALPLPGTIEQWLPQTVTINNIKQSTLHISPSGQLWFFAEKGVHELLLEGPVGSDIIELVFPIKPHYVDIISTGWDSNGYSEHQLLNNNLQFTKSSLKTQDNLPYKQRFPNFIKITRTLHLGIDWAITSQARRLAPPQGAFLVKVPLLYGESVLSDNVQVIKDIAQINFAPDQNVVEWRSKLTKHPEFSLQATTQNDLTEIWRILANPIWHVNYQGIPPINEQNIQQQWLPTFSPWPGEKVTLNISRPMTVQSNTFTIDNSILLVQPGKQATDVLFNFTVRTSQAHTHSIFIPKNAKLQALKINNLYQPINQKPGEVLIALLPGTQNIFLSWRLPNGLMLKQNTSNVELNAPSVNHTTQINIPQNRWIVFVNGPLVGPAILFWGAFLIMIIVAIALGKSKLTPLSILQWLLLGSGLLITTPIISLLVVLWFICLQLRSNQTNATSLRHFRITQILLILLTVLFLFGLLHTISSGLLKHPNMQIAQPNIPISQAFPPETHENFSMITDTKLIWYQDVIKSQLPKTSVLSLPMNIYRSLMLLWALWLTISLFHWLRWGWKCFSSNGVWSLKSSSN